LHVKASIDNIAYYNNMNDKVLPILLMANRGADPRASQETQGACTMRLREAQSDQVPCSGARRQNKVLDEVSAAAFLAVW